VSLLAKVKNVFRGVKKRRFMKGEELQKLIETFGMRILLLK